MSTSRVAYLQGRLRLRRAIEAARLRAIGREPSLDDEPLDYYAHQRAMEVIAELESELNEKGAEK